ncbi:MAG TPA: hypothetical protein PLL50_00360 [Propionicimonas sp.]|nr:hypothetical protein [Propionicimonas sp.]
MTVLALVESPAQLLHVLEWCHRHAAAERIRLVVLAPVDERTRVQLAAMADYAGEENIAVEWHDPRTALSASARVIAELRPQVADAHTLLLGDPFSGLIQALLPRPGNQQVVVVDDGTATLEFAAQLAAGERLRRWHGRSFGPVRAVLAERARRFFDTARLQLFTVMAVTGLPPSRVQRHSYAWTRHRFGQVRTRPGVDVIGSSLVETGVVRPGAYLDAVAGLAIDGSAGRYFAHRRESAEKLDRIATQTGLEIVRPSVPLEVELRRTPVAARLASFPSSVGYTLPLVLAGSGVRISVQPIPEEMFAEGVTQRARSFLARLGDDVRTTARVAGRARVELATLT